MRDDPRLEALLHERDNLRVEISRLYDNSSPDTTELARLRFVLSELEKRIERFQP